MAYTKYSLTPANNTAAPPDGAPEGMLPSAVNDTMRDMMAQIRDVGDGIRDGTYTMTAPKITGGTITGATFAAGTVSLPSITTTGDTNTGIFFPTADTIAFAEGGVEAVRFDASGNVGIGTSTITSGAGWTPRLVLDGTAAALVVRQSATGQENSFGNGNGLFIDSLGNSTATNNNIIFRNTSVNSNFTALERMRITSGGFVGINTSSPTTHLTVDTKQANYTDGIDISNSTQWGYGSSINFRTIPTDGGSLATVARIQQYYQASNKYGLKFFKYDSSLGEAMNITAEGFLLCPGVYNNTTANAANVHVFSNGELTRSTSSRKYKTDIVDYSKGLNEVMLLRPVSYKGINDGDKQFAGLIAEEVADKGLVEFVQYAEDGTPDGLAYPHMIALLTKAIQEQQALIENLTTRLNALEGK